MCNFDKINNLTRNYKCVVFLSFGHYLFCKLVNLPAKITYLILIIIYRLFPNIECFVEFL